MWGRSTHGHDLHNFSRPRVGNGMKNQITKFTWVSCEGGCLETRFNVHQSRVQSRRDVGGHALETRARQAHVLAPPIFHHIWLGHLSPLPWAALSSHGIRGNLGYCLVSGLLIVAAFHHITVRAVVTCDVQTEWITCRWLLRNGSQVGLAKSEIITDTAKYITQDWFASSCHSTTLIRQILQFNQAMSSGDLRTLSTQTTSLPFTGSK